MDQLHLLKQVKCFILDLDGTVYLGKRILDGSIEFLQTLEKNKIKFNFFTNNSSKNAKYYVKKIRNMGYDAQDNMMLISSQVIIKHIQETMPNKKIFVHKYFYGCD